MLDDFLVRALLAGAGLALVTGPAGCFIVWRRLAYFGETIAHSALLVIPAATACRFATSPERMAIGAAATGIVAVAGGLLASANFDTPSGPSIVVIALALFVVSRVRLTRSAESR